ncbi:hypothetical protein FQN49_001554 [Arthroderma sp. PD_2]|nr:hypothetical protein FQN49_001554 [Arthroderma sp. PD_2]
MDIVDNIIIEGKNNNTIQELKNLFGLGRLRNADFANTLSSGITGWQATNWDPAISGKSFYEYCSDITSDRYLYPTSPEQKASAKRIIKAGGHGREAPEILPQLLNFVGWLNKNTLASCTEKGQTVEDCFNSYDENFYQQDSADQSWRAWPWQFCNEWGYLQTGSGAPKNIRPVISRLIDLPYTSNICKQAFGITKPANVDLVNKYGSLDIEYDRLALIDGASDPWKEAGVHATAARKRQTSTNKPYILIADAVHHWDENGLLPNETTAELPPQRIKEVQAEEVRFVKEWMKDWKRKHFHRGV